MSTAVLRLLLQVPALRRGEQGALPAVRQEVGQVRLQVLESLPPVIRGLGAHLCERTGRVSGDWEDTRIRHSMPGTEVEGWTGSERQPALTVSRFHEEMALMSFCR